MQQEIDLIELLKHIWSRRRKVLWIIAGFAVAGLFIALVTPKEYTAKTILVTRTESRTAGGNLSGLAAMVGISLGSNSEAGNELTPVDYPDFIKSLSFQKELMYAPLEWNRFSKPVSLFEYYSEHYKPGFFEVLKKYTIGLPGTIIGWFKKPVAQPVGKASSENETGVVYLSGAELGVRGILTKKIKLTLNPTNNFITLEARAPEGKAAAQAALKARGLLQEKVTQLKIQKAKENLAFTQKLYDDKKVEFMAAQDKLAEFRDRNNDLWTEKARTEDDRLFSEYQIAFSVYSELAKQLENAKIRVKEDTPIFSVVEEPVVPLSQSKPKTARILLIWIFLGGVVGPVWVMGQRIVEEAGKRWAEKN